jgi:DNA-binding transcriptional LysR family regulator
MQATPRALELAAATRQALRQIERVFDRDTDFDPAASDRTFAIRLSDLLGLMLLPPLFDDLAAEGPSLRFDVTHVPPMRTVDALEKDELDLAVSMGLVHSSSIRSEVLMHDHMVCVMRQDHPAAAGTMTLDRFMAERHLKVSISPTDLRFVDDVLAREGLVRRTSLNVPHWLLVPHVLERSDLISVMPQRFASALLKTNPILAIRELPFSAEPFEWLTYWHRRHDGNPAIAWLREKLRSVAGTLP